MTQAIATQNRNVNPMETLAKLLTDNSAAIRKLAPKYVNTNRLVSLAIEASGRNATLQKCSPMSVLNFCKKCAEWGTDRIGAGGVWPVPYWNNKGNCYEMQAIPDWRLLIERTKKAKAIKDAYLDVVREKDQFEYTRGTSPSLVHTPARGDRGKITEVYCVYVLPDDSKNFVVMDWEQEIIPIRNRSKAWQAWIEKKYSCPWVTDEAEMGKKTCAKRAMKLFEGASVELTAMLEADNAFTGNVEIDVTPRAPVPMPQALSEGETDPTSSPATGSGTTAPEPKPESAGTTAPAAATPAPVGSIEVPDGCEMSEGKLTAIEPKKLQRKEDAKDGTSYKKGDAYFMYSFHLDDGSKYTTFSETVANDSAALLNKGVKIIWKASGAYRNIQSVHAV